MNAPLLPRLPKPILGGGEDGAFADLLPWFAPPPPEAPPYILRRPEADPGVIEPRASLPTEPRPTAASDADPSPAAPVSRPVPPPAPEERITVENLGQLAIRVTGTSHGDRLFGGPGDDRLDGLAGDDILFGSPGRDLLYGGAGHDTIRYDLLRAEVSLDTRFQRISLEDGEDQYDGIEVVDLRDGDWILTADGPAALVQRLYLAATGHAPTAAAMIRETAALKAGGTAEALAGRLTAGAGEEVQQRVQAALDAPREGRLDQPVWLPDAEAVLLTRMADLALGGAPGRDAFLHWLDELEAGAAPDSIATEMLATPEGLAHAPEAEPHALALAATHWML